MPNGAVIAIVGNITKDPELRFAASGNAWATFSVAVNEKTRNKNGDWSDHTSYFNCKVFGKNAENLAESVAKGTRVVVEGKLRDESWKDASGNDRRSQVLYAEEISVSLKYATAQVTRVASTNNDGGSYASNDNTTSDSTSLVSDEPEDNPFL